MRKMPNPMTASVRIILKLPAPRSGARPLARIHIPPQEISYLGDLNIRTLACRAAGYLYDTLTRLPSHRDPPGNADQVRILELHSRTFVAIIEDRIDLAIQALFIELFG